MIGQVADARWSVEGVADCALALESGVYCIRSEGTAAIRIRDPWNTASGFLEFPRPSGQEMWVPLAVVRETASADYRLTMLNIDDVSRTCVWIIDAEGTFKADEPSAAVDGYALYEMLVNEPLDFYCFAKLAVGAPRNPLHAARLQKFLTVPRQGLRRSWYLLLGLSVLYRLAGEADIALEVMRRLEGLEPLDRGLCADAIQYVLLGDAPRNPAVALSMLRTLLPGAPPGSPIHLRLRRLQADALLSSKHFQRAEAIYRELAASDGEFFHSPGAVSCVYATLAQNRIDDALSLLERIVGARLATNAISPSKLFRTIVKLAGREERFTEIGPDGQPYRGSPTMSMLGIPILADSPLARDAARSRDFAGLVKHLEEIAERLSDVNRQFLFDQLLDLGLDMPAGKRDAGRLKLVAARVGETAKQELKRILAFEGGDLAEILTATPGIGRAAEAPPASRRKSIALTFSGFLRGYQHYRRILHAIGVASKEYDVYTFYSLFDRLGNLKIPPYCPPELRDYTNGGFYREILKTRALNVSRFAALFEPTAYEVTERRDDDFYRSAIGIEHPQWLMVNQAFELAQRHAAVNALQFDYVARARVDNFPKDSKCLIRAIEDPALQEGSADILVMSRWSLSPYKLSDRFAFGRSAAMAKYCAIGSGRNFVSVEDTDAWRADVHQPYLPTGGSHEAHLGCWLKLQGIGFHRRPYLDA